MNYIEELANEIEQEVPSDLLPSGDSHALFYLYALLLLVKGESVTPEDVHNGWATWMTSKDESHESLVPFSRLTDETRREDAPFVTAILRVASRHK